MSDHQETHPDAINVLRALQFGEEDKKAPAKPITIIGLYHEADTAYMTRLETFLGVRRRQLTANEGIQIDYQTYELWENFPNDGPIEALKTASYVILLVSVQFLKALYEDNQLYQNVQRAIRDKDATTSIILMTTKVAWSWDEFPVSVTYPLEQDKALSSIRVKEEIYADLVEEIVRWLPERRNGRFPER